MLATALLLAAPVLALERRGKPQALCDSTRLLNENTDCHLPCGVHSQGNDAGSHCSTNFCGTDGVCCRQGVTGGACDGVVGCNGWHCCVCTPSGTSGPTGAPQVQILGDPFTTYQGQRTQFFMPPATLMPLISCGNVEVLGRAVNSVVKSDDQQWFDLFQIRINAAQILSVEARRGKVTGQANADVASDIDVLDTARVAATLANARLGKETAVQALTTLDVSVQDKAVNVTGTFKTNSANITIAQDVSKTIGNGFAEKVQLDAADLGLVIKSSVAGKFANNADRVRNLHVDVAFTNLNAQMCKGTLPEIWGVKQMSKATAKLLVPPKH